MFRLIVCLLFLVVAPSTSRADDRLFEERIRPLLVGHCVKCHGPTAQEGDVRLDSSEAVLGSGLAVPGEPEDSRLLQVIRYHDDDTQMPPSGRLTDEQIASVEAWLLAGATWPAGTQLFPPGYVNPQQWKTHWAFQPNGTHLSKSVSETSIDQLVNTRLEAAGLRPAPPAALPVLVRRLSYAVTGLPPDYSVVHAAASAKDPKAFLRQYTETLLASPAYGERWGRYWLDTARYADTKGYVFQEDRSYPDAWRYREWVIRAFNDDMPYDEFVRRQLAADQLPGKEDPKQLAAMGFLTLGRRFLNNRHDIIDDRIDVTTRGLMGLTVSCARCHDHKYDPVPAADYYSLYGVFASSDEPKDAPSTLRLVDRDKPFEPYIFVRGQPGNRGERVPRRFLQAVAGENSPPFQNGSGRLEMAEQIASPQNPLTARVAVNRIWAHLFGQGLADNPSDFGVRSGPPSHPELLDYLALRLIDNGWSVKSIIREIVASDVYQRSNDGAARDADVDPENRLLAVFPRLRLDFEARRDSLLYVAGNLERQIGGPSVRITDAPYPRRRTVYAYIDRQNLPGVFRTFDFPNPDAHSPRRFETTVPQQALFELNHPFLMEQAESVAALTLKDLSDPQEASAMEVSERLFRRILQRAPTSEEQSWVGQALADYSRGEGTRVTPGWEYGYGECGPNAATLIRFTRLPAFRENRWMGGEKLPDAELGWVSLTSTGGHPGNGLTHAAVRRWTAPGHGTVNVRGVLEHPADAGNGVRGTLLKNGDQLLLQQQAAQGKRPMGRNDIEVRPGDTLDFIVDSLGDTNSDSFLWKIRLELTCDEPVRRFWNSEADFSGQLPLPPLEAAAAVAQALMLSNEFIFLD